MNNAIFNAHHELGVPLTGLAEHCQAYNSNAVKAIKPNTQYFTKRMCSGDNTEGATLSGE